MFGNGLVIGGLVKAGPAATGIKLGVVIKQFLANAPEIELADITDIWGDTIGKMGGGICPPTNDGLLQLLPGRDGTDGFFIAVLQAKLRYQQTIIMIK